MSKVKLFLIFFQATICSFAATNDSCIGLKDTVYIIFERHFNKDIIKVFQNGQLNNKEKVTTLRENGLSTTENYSMIVYDNIEDKIVVRCGIWSRQVKLDKAHKYIYVRRMRGVGFLWIDYPSKQKKFR